MNTECNTPHTLFTVWEPDAVAECLIPITEPHGTEIYDKIWTKIMPLMTSKYDSHGERKLEYEVPEIHDKDTLAFFWSHFTEDEQRALNAWAEDY